MPQMPKKSVLSIPDPKKSSRSHAGSPSVLDAAMFGRLFAHLFLAESWIRQLHVDDMCVKMGKWPPNGQFT
jgi:hypothetical protein